MGGSKCLVTYPTYTIYHINMIPEIRAIPLLFLILSLKSCLTMAEFDYSKTIFIVKPMGPDAAASLRSEHNTKHLISFHSEDGRKKSSDAVALGLYKAVDVSTGYEYAAKIFYGGDWKKEVEILKSVSYISVRIDL